MSDKTKSLNEKNFSIYTYGVSMVISVFASDEEEARSKLDDTGGFMSSRVVDLKDIQTVYKESE